MFAPMANVYWTIPLDLPVRPYIGGGLGYAWNEVGLKSIGTTSFQTLHDDNWRLATIHTFKTARLSKPFRGCWIPSARR